MNSTCLGLRRWLRGSWCLLPSPMTEFNPQNPCGGGGALSPPSFLPTSMHAAPPSKEINK